MAIKMKFPIFLVVAMLTSSCNMMHKFQERAKLVNGFEKAALVLAQENRQLKAKIHDLEFQAETLKSQVKFLELQIEKKTDSKAARTIASVAPVDKKNDLVKFGIYKWKPNQLLAVAQKEFKNKNYEKSAQFFQTYKAQYGDLQKTDDQLLFQSGFASYESGNHEDWAIEHFSQLIKEYPTSAYYRSAKLWLAMAHLKQGKEKEFFSTVEEFRKKYRNTEEWEILSAHYEKILIKYK